MADRPHARQPPRNSKNKGGKKRKKSSGPNWLLIGIAGGGGLLVVGGLIWAMIALFSPSHESIPKGILAALEDMEDILADVNDAASAQLAVPKIEEVGERMERLNEQRLKLEESDPITKEEKLALKEKYNEPLKEANKRIRDRVTQLSKQRDVIEILKFPMLKTEAKLRTVAAAETKQQMEEKAKKQEEFHAKAREKHEATVARIQQNQASNPSSNAPGRPPFRNSPPGGNTAGNQTVTPEDALPAETPVSRRWGDKTAVIRLKGWSNPRDPRFRIIRDRIREAVKSVDQMKGTFETTSMNTRDGDTFIVFGPLFNFDKFVTAIDFGSVVNTYPEKRLVIVKPDLDKLSAP